MLQGPGYVSIVYEMIHEARVIPLDGRPHIGKDMRTWNGDSRGRWEGNTLVVDITNYNDKGSIATNVATQRVRAIPQSEELHVVERCRLTRTINYEADRGSQSLRDALESGDPVAPEPDYQIFEYACHGELGLPR